MNRAQRRQQDMFQCQVTTKDGKALPVGPSSNVSDLPEALALAINKSVAQGKEKDWHDARVVKVTALPEIQH